MEDNQNLDQDSNIIDENIPFLLRTSIFWIIISIFISWFIIYTLMTPVTIHKPAIYLYPETKRQIYIKLDDTIKYKNTIPQYKNGWFVEADINGIIRDLKPQYTECKKLPFKEFGFEYSKKACETNKYPYIYWDGKSINKLLPDLNKGYIVNKDNIEFFLSEKADELNFNKNEKEEFVRYWDKKIKSTGWKQFKICFLQNDQVNGYLPLYVEPQPNNINRVEIIVSKPQKHEIMKEPKLIPFKREGFTLVEWGGMILR